MRASSFSGGDPLSLEKSLKYETVEDHNRSQIPIALIQDDIKDKEESPKPEDPLAQSYANQLIRQIEESLGH